MATLCRWVLLLASAALAGGMAILGLQYPFLVLLAVGAATWRRFGAWRGSLSSHGTARLAGMLDLAGMLGERGLILGRASYLAGPTKWQAVRCLLSRRIPSALACRLAFAGLFGKADRGLIRVKDYVHLLTCAPAGAGKSVAAIIPNLLSHLGSAVVLDPKGELYEKTAEHRRTRLGHRIVRLDPFGVAGPAETADTLSPPDFIDQNDPGFLDEVRSLADMLVVRTGNEPDPHWNDSAVLVLAAFISFVCGCEPDVSNRNLGLVRDLVSSRLAFTESIAAMRTVKDFGGVVAKFGELLGWFVDRELGSVMSSVNRHTAWMDSPAVAASLSRSSFDPRWLRAGRVTVYLILPHDKLTTLAPLMRCWLGTILRVATKHGASERNPVLFIVDEAAHLGRMQAIQDALTLLRGYGIRMWLFFQSLDQLKVCYGEHAPVMLDNLSTQQFFGINSFDTADHLSQRLGDATILVESINRGTSTSRPIRSGTAEGAGNVTTSESYNVGPQGRRLIRPEEWLVLPESVGIVFHKNLPPIATELVRHYEAPEFANGGTGRGRRLGLPALAASLLVLVASLGGSALLLAVPGLLQQAAFDPRPGVATLGMSTSGMARPVVARPGQRPVGRPPSSYPLPRLSDPSNWRRPAASPVPASGPVVDWDFDGRVWQRRPDGSRVQISGPPLPGRSGR